MIDLRKIIHQNLYDIANLSVSEEQKRFITPNTDSIMQAYVAITNHGVALPFGIYEDETPVGFIMFGYTPKDSIELPEVTRGNYCLWRLMIDQRYQNKGYGKAALEMGMAYIRQLAMGTSQYCWLCYQPENEVVVKLCRSIGFRNCGEKLNDKNIALMPLR